MANQEQVDFLCEYGVEQWNQWRRENPDVEIDLSFAELRDINLKRANFDNANLENANLNFANLNSANLANANLKSANFNSANLNSSNLINADFENANLEKVTFAEAYLKFANLKSANLKFAYLKSANLENANLDYATLDFSNFEKANLNSADLENTSLYAANLNSARLKRANLNAANLNSVNLSFVDFRNADLSNTFLRVVTALGTSFKGSTLTGACIEDWHVSNTTNFENVVCDYIYLKWDKEKNEPIERRPSAPNRNFAPGEFTKLFQQARETIDLIFSEGIDWQAFLSSYQNVQLESNHGELDIRAIEKSSDGSFVIRVEVPENTNKADLEAEFYERYEGELKRLEGVYQRELQFKEREIEIYHQQNTNLTEITKSLAAQNQQFFINNGGTQVAGDNIKQSGNFGIGHMSGGTFKDNAKAIGQHNEATQQNLAQAAADIKALIDQLEGDYESTPMGNMQMGTEIVSRISQNPTLKSRVINALKEASVTAFEEAISHPVASIVIAGTQGFIEAE